MAAEQRAPRRPGVNVFDQTRPMWQTMLIFLVPLMISNVLQSTSQTFSYVFLGRMLGVSALAAVSAVFPIVFLLFSFLIGIGSGATVLIGQAYGAGDAHRVKKVAGTVLGATVLFSIITMLLGVVFSPVMLKGLGTPASILPMSDLYTRVVFLTFPLYFPYIIYTVFLRGTGDTKTPLWFLVLGTALSVLFTPMLIRGWFGLPTLGVASVAISGLLSTLVAFPALLWHLRRSGNPLAFDREMARDMIFDTRILWLVLRIGIPTGLQTIMVSLAEIAVISFVNRYGRQCHGRIRCGEPGHRIRAVSRNLDEHYRLDFRRAVHRRTPRRFAWIGRTFRGCTQLCDRRYLDCDLLRLFLRDPRMVHYRSRNARDRARPTDDYALVISALR